MIQSTCLSFLSHTANCCWLSILHNVTFQVTLSIHLTLSSPLPMSISLFSMSVSPLLPCKWILQDAFSRFHTPALASSPCTFVLWKWFLFLNFMSFKLFCSFLTVSSLHRIEGGYNLALDQALALRECFSWFDHLSRPLTLLISPIKLFLLLITCMITGVVFLISFKNFSLSSKFG